MSNNRKDGGNSDYPNYPKPVIAKFGSRQEELQGILNRIQEIFSDAPPKLFGNTAW